MLWSAFSSPTQLSIREGNGWLVSDRQEHWFCYCGRIEMEATGQRDSVLSVGTQRLPSTGWRSMRGLAAALPRALH